MIQFDWNWSGFKLYCFRLNDRFDVVYSTFDDVGNQWSIIEISETVILYQI